MSRKKYLFILITIIFSFTIFINLAYHHCEGEHCYMCNLIVELSDSFNSLYLFNGIVIQIIIAIICFKRFLFKRKDYYIPNISLYNLKVRLDI